MNLRKKAISGIIPVCLVVAICGIADATDGCLKETVPVAVDMRTDLATDGTAGIVAKLSQISVEAFEEASAEIFHTENMIVAAAEQSTEETETIQEEAMSVGSYETIVEQSEITQESDIALDLENSKEDITEETQKEENDSAKNEANEDASEVDEWENRLMADVNEFLYVRASGDAEAEIVGKLYKGDVADVVETGDTWTRVVSGAVDGYVKNDYCVSGADALAYAQDNVETEAQVNTNGLRVRDAAADDAAVITAVYEGTTLQVDKDADTEDGWVAVKYEGQTAYVSADYVTTEFALGKAVTIEEEKAALAKKAEEEAAAKAAKAAQEAKAAKTAQTKKQSQTTTVQNAAVSASYDDVTLLAALIQCEAGSESYEGQLAVGAVVMNRLRSGAYPSSIYNVIYQSGQFPPAARGLVAQVAARGPRSSCMQAAQQALSGADNTGGATRFARAGSGRTGVVIGNHVFY